MAPEPQLPLNFGMLLFPGFQALDVFGPLDCLNILSQSHKMNLSIISQTRGSVSTEPPESTGLNVLQSFNQHVLATHSTDDDAPVDVLLIPGGLGLRAPEAELAPYVEYIKKVGPRCQYIITICTGAPLLAKSGVLDGKRATTNKAAWRFTAWGPKTDWIARARWVQDGNIWTAAGVSAGIDVTLAWIGTVYGEETATAVSNRMEYRRATDSTDDPFSALHDCQDVPAQ
ncbi:class I glutamine amidotransferase-like protein [Rhizodiscina lignyota]|uniref:Class I glutamine amidotransferase-like protein n=1 Tax=Rhizodiscina lignyota TaxID=1504668 RepID=A0A9P4IAQ1_9PEZI|nr:class I glutamine amidotransferase-like protein [Rhizodiscina lignyota]